MRVGLFLVLISLILVSVSAYVNPMSLRGREVAESQVHSKSSAPSLPKIDPLCDKTRYFDMEDKQEPCDNPLSLEYAKEIALFAHKTREMNQISSIPDDMKQQLVRAINKEIRKSADQGNSEIDMTYQFPCVLTEEMNKGVQLFVQHAYIGYDVHMSRYYLVTEQEADGPLETDMITLHMYWHI